MPYKQVKHHLARLGALMAVIGLLIGTYAASDTAGYILTGVLAAYGMDRIATDIMDNIV